MYNCSLPIFLWTTWLRRMPANAEESPRPCLTLPPTCLLHHQVLLFYPDGKRSSSEGPMAADAVHPGAAVVVLPQGVALPPPADDPMDGGAPGGMGQQVQQPGGGGDPRAMGGAPQGGGQQGLPVGMQPVPVNFGPGQMMNQQLGGPMRQVGRRDTTVRLCARARLCVCVCVWGVKECQGCVRGQPAALLAIAWCAAFAATLLEMPSAPCRLAVPLEACSVVAQLMPPRLIRVRVEGPCAPAVPYSHRIASHPLCAKPCVAHARVCILAE